MRNGQRDALGESMAQYAITIAAIAVVAVGAFQLVGDCMAEQFDQAFDTYGSGTVGLGTRSGARASFGDLSVAPIK